jgi:two-component system NtrC family sensor kinase
MTILGNVQQLQRRLKSQNLYSEENEHRFDRMNEAIQKIKTVIEGLKYFSRESEKAPLVEVAISEVIERSLNYCQEMIKAHGITLVLDEVPEGNVRCHPMELTQVLFGIIKNADEAVMKTPEHSDRWIRLSYEKKAGRIFIRIINGGPLIDEKYREKLFHPFFTTKDVNEGTGLSLSIAQGVIRENGGDLILDDCESNTCFRIELPIVN